MVALWQTEETWLDDDIRTLAIMDDFLGFAITDLTSVGVHLEAVRTPHHAHDVVAGDGDVFGRLADVSASVGAALLVGQTVTVVGAEVAADAKDAFFHGWAGTLVDDWWGGAVTDLTSVAVFLESEFAEHHTHDL